MIQMENTSPHEQEKATDAGAATSPASPAKRQLLPTAEALAAPEKQIAAMQRAHLDLLRTWLAMAPDMRLAVSFDEQFTSIDVSGWLA